LEQEIIPALRAGFVVLSDRYIFTALARAGVRGIDRPWLRTLYGFAIAPHLVFYLNIDVKNLIQRVLETRGMDFWESGMDLKTGDDIYDSFRAYQSKLLKEYASMADEFKFRVVDARRPVDRIQDELRRQVEAFLEPAEKPAEPALACGHGVSEVQSVSKIYLRQRRVRSADQPDDEFARRVARPCRSEPEGRGALG